MKKRVKTVRMAAQFQSQRAHPQLPGASAKSPASLGGAMGRMTWTLNSLVNSSWRGFAVAASLLLGGYCIETHRTLNYTLTGFALWAVAITLSLAWFPQVPGAGIFPMPQSPEAKGNQEWSTLKIALVGGGALVALGLSNYFLGKAWAICLLFSLLALGWLLTLLEDRLPQALGDNPLKPAPINRVGFPWVAAVILLFGSFFLFYHYASFTTGFDSDAIKELELGDSCIAGWTTPYVEAIEDVPIFPYFWMGMFYKVVGCTFHHGVFFMIFFNLAGYLFFYGFVRFYLQKAPALAATLFLCASHWVLYPAREINGARGLVVPLGCATLYFFARALEKGKARDYALFGTLLSFMMLTHFLGWAFLIFFILVLTTFWLCRRSALQNQKKSWALALFVIFLWYLPMMITYHKSNPYCFPIFWFKEDVIWKGTKFFIPWGNLRTALQMFNIGTPEYLMGYFPILSPWEGLFLLAGLAWCLRRFFKLSTFFIVLGLLGGLAPTFLTNANIYTRSVAAAPFVFLLVGIGLDRLTMVLAAPLGHRGGGLRFLLGGIFLALAVGWQYDLFFNHLPLCKEAYWNPSGRTYLYGTITAKHLEGWNTYVDLWDGTYQHPENDFFYSKSDMEKGQRIIFHQDLSSLPLKTVPPKGALILLPDQMGKAFHDWIGYYYPASQEQQVLNPFGDIEFRLWEITPNQIQKTLALPGPPPGNMVLSWFDTQNRKLGQIQIPTLSANFLNYEWHAPQNPPFPWEKTSYFIVQGSLENPEGKVLALEANGRVDGFIGGRKIQLDGQDPSKRLEVPLYSMKPEPFKIRYFLPKGGEFNLNLFEKTPLGWDMIPSHELKP